MQCWSSKAPCRTAGSMSCFGSRELLRVRGRTSIRSCAGSVSLPRSWVWRSFRGRALPLTTPRLARLLAQPRRQGARHRREHRQRQGKHKVRRRPPRRLQAPSHHRPRLRRRQRSPRLKRAIRHRQHEPPKGHRRSSRHRVDRLHSTTSNHKGRLKAPPVPRLGRRFTNRLPRSCPSTSRRHQRNRIAWRPRRRFGSGRAWAC